MHYKLRCILLGVVFLVGAILGIVFYESLIKVQWLMFEDCNWLDDVLAAKGFFALLFLLFWSSYKFVFFILLCNLVRQLYPIFYFVVFIRGMVFFAAIISAVEEFLIVGIIYSLFILIVYLIAFLAVLMLCCGVCARLSADSSLVFCVRLKKLALLALISMLILFAVALALSFVLVFILKPLFLFL